MKNKKGFTLIELLAVIVILAIIMVIAIPQILNIIDSSKEKAWEDSVKIVEKSIRTYTSIDDPTGQFSKRMSDLCVTDATSQISAIADVGNMTVSCTGTGPYVFTLTGTGQFDQKSATITCETSGVCSSSIVAPSSNPYETRFDGNYTAYKWNDVSTSGYSSAGTKHGSSGWYTSLNSESVAYLRTDGTTPEVCGVFGSGQGNTVCMTSSYYNSNYSSAGSYVSDFEDCNDNVEELYYPNDNTDNTCLKGYTKEKMKEILSKGAMYCSIYYGMLDCPVDGLMECAILKNGQSICYGPMGNL